MLGLVVPILLSLTAMTKAIHYYQQPFYSAASEAQIRFALENKYDDTGPGAKEPEFAYNTYKTLDEALIGYLDDPDTKLPEFERERAIQKLVRPDYSGEYRPDYENQELKRYYPKTVEEYTGYNKQKPESVENYSPPKTVKLYKGYRQPQSQRPLVLMKLQTSPPRKFYQSAIAQDSGLLKQLERTRTPAESYRLQKPRQPVRINPLSVAHFTREDAQQSFDQFDPHPKYTYSYGVHAPETGDSKSAHETRQGGTVRGYYSYMDPDGKQRTVHYTADDERGFRATVEREDHGRAILE